MSFVFISHASQDKPAIRHIVDALIAKGHKIWLDKPNDMGYTPDEIDAHFFRIHAGKPYRQAIDEALRDASAVLVCWSKNAKDDRTVWLAEATVARTLCKLVACRIDDVNRSQLPDNHGAEEIPDLRPERKKSELTTALALLCADVDRKCEATTELNLAEAKDTPRDVFAPYLVDRTDQEDEVGTALECVAASGGVKAFFLAGPENECLDEFLDRLTRYSCPERLGEGRSWHSIAVEWPRDVATQDFAKTYRRRLVKALDIPTASDDAQIAADLASKGQPVAVLTFMSAREWKSDEDRRVGAWLEMWQRLAAQPQRFAALPIICLRMPAAQPGWRPAPGGTAPGGSMSNAAIWRAVTAVQRGPGLLARMLGGGGGERVEFSVPPILHPVSRSHVDTWLWRDEISEQFACKKEKAVARVTELFSGRGADQHGLSLRDFASGVSPIFRRGS